jgi:hypothetical protein
MSDTFSLAVEEYRALRATVRERGTMRLIVTAVTFVAWAALATAVQALFTVPVLTLLPLTVLATGFEVVFALHVGIERIGRYLYVHYETPGIPIPGWEHAIGEVALRAGAGSGIDPIFSVAFIVAALLNLVPVALMTADLSPALPGGLPAAFAGLGLVHALVVARVLHARRFAAAQRQRDVELFEQQAGRRPQSIQ